MADNLLKLRHNLNSFDNFNRGLDVARIDSESDSIESKPKDFFAITHISELIEEIIEIIDKQLKDNKSKLTSNRGGTTVLSGPINSGKTHALLAAYNLFRRPDLTVDWLKESKIKFNRFNVLSIKNNSKSCLLPATEIKADNIWQAIFEELDETELLDQADGIPGLEVLKQLVKDEYTTLFIDDLEKLFKELEANNKEAEIKANKTFISNLLDLAAQDNRLSVFLAVRGENKLLHDIFNPEEVLFKKTEELAEREKVIKNYLFENKASKEIIKEKAASYLEKCKESEFELDYSEDEISSFVKSYPFHPELLAMLDEIYQDNYEELINQTTQFKILANAFKSSSSQRNFLTVDDLDNSFLKNLFPDLNHSLKLSLQEAETKLQKQILNVVFFYTILSSRVEVKDIFKMVISPETDINKFKEGLKQLTDDIEYLIKDHGCYRLKPQKDILTLIKEEDVSKEEIRKELFNYNYKELFPFEIKLFGADEIPDTPDLEVVLFLDAPKAKDKLADFINNQLYQDYEYKNTLVPIIPKRELINVDTSKQMEKIIAMKKAKDKVAEQEKMAKYFKEEEKKLRKILKDLFGQYLYWIGSKNKVKLYKTEFELNDDLDFRQHLEADKPLLKEYLKKIISNNKRGVKALNLLLDMKRKKGAPFITKDAFKSVIEDLLKDGDIVVKQKEILKDSSHVAFDDYILCPSDFKEGRKISEQTEQSNIDKKVKSKIKDDIFAVLSEKDAGIKIEELLDRLKDIDYYSDVKPATFRQMIEILKVNSKLIGIEGKNKIYKNTSSLLKDTKNMVSDQKASKELLRFIAEELFSEEYKIYKQEDIQDSKELEKVLLLKDFASNEEEKKFLKDEIYNNIRYKNKLLIITAKDELFVDEYLDKMKLVIGLSEMQDDINWDKRQVEFVLKRQNRVLSKSLTDNFGRCFLAKEGEAGIEIYQKEFEFEQLEEDLIEEFIKEVGVETEKEELVEAENDDMIDEQEDNAKVEEDEQVEAKQVEKQEDKEDKEDDAVEAETDDVKDEPEDDAKVEEDEQVEAKQVEKQEDKEDNAVEAETDDAKDEPEDDAKVEEDEQAEEKKVESEEEEDEDEEEDGILDMFI